MNQRLSLRMRCPGTGQPLQGYGYFEPSKGARVSLRPSRKLERYGALQRTRSSFRQNARFLRGSFGPVRLKRCYLYDKILDSAQ